MSTPGRLGALLAAAALALAGCSGSAEEAPAPTDTTQPTPSRSATTTPEPATPTPEPTPSAVGMSDAACAQLYSAIESAMALNPDRDAVIPTLDAAAEAVPPELRTDFEVVDRDIRAHLDEVDATEGFVDPVELEIPASLVAGCAAAEVDLGDVPYPVASVPEICVELHRISQYQDLEGLEIVVDYSLRRARTYTPAEIEPGVRAFSDRMETVWDEERPTESAEDEAARLELGERCDEEGWLLLQPS